MPKKKSDSEKKKTTGFAPDRSWVMNLKRKGGPTGLTPEIQEHILHSIKSGVSLETAVHAAGIHRDTLTKWFQRGDAYLNAIRKGEEPNPDHEIYADFVEKTVIAGAESEVRDMMRMDDYGDTHWQAVAWRLERRFPHKYSLVNRVEVAGNIDHSHTHTSVPLNEVLDRLPLVEREKLLETILRIEQEAANPPALPAPIPQVLEHQALPPAESAEDSNHSQNGLHE